MPDVWIGASINTDALVEEIRGSLTREEAIQFILDLDSKYEDLAFTMELHARLGLAIREELEFDAE